MSNDFARCLGWDCSRAKDCERARLGEKCAPQAEYQWVMIPLEQRGEKCPAFVQAQEPQSGSEVGA